MIVLLVEIDSKFDVERYEFLFNLLEPSSKSRVAQFYHYVDSLRTLIGELIFRKHVIEKMNVQFNDIRIKRDKYGKPFIAGEENLFFNVSHSGEYVICAIDDCDLGIDIECVEDLDLGIAKRVFSDAEYNHLIHMNHENVIEEFYDIWTKKECFIKAIGKGLSKNLKSFSVISDYCCNRVVEEGKLLNWYVYSIDILRNYKIALCTSKCELDYTVNRISMNDIFDFFRSLADWEILRL